MATINERYGRTVFRQMPSKTSDPLEMVDGMELENNLESFSFH